MICSDILVGLEVRLICYVLPWCTPLYPRCLTIFFDLGALCEKKKLELCPRIEFGGFFDATAWCPR